MKYLKVKLFALFHIDHIYTGTEEWFELSPAECRESRDTGRPVSYAGSHLCASWFCGWGTHLRLFPENGGIFKIKVCIKRRSCFKSKKEL